MSTGDAFTFADVGDAVVTVGEHVFRLDDPHVESLRFLIRDGLRRSRRKRERLIARFGVHANTSGVDLYLTHLADLYEMLGKDPSAITRQEPPAP